MLGNRIAKKVPSVVSLDATPIDFAQLGAYHAGGKARQADRQGLKFKWNQSVFQAAAALVSWSAWCKRSLVKDYGARADRVAVIPPGVELSQWEPAPKAPPEGRKLRLLFVGGDFGRKGGPVLLDAFKQSLGDTCELDIVSNDAPEGSGAVRVHRGLKPNTPELRKLYADADLFVFPSRGDCTPVATVEAMASGLPIVTTSVGSLSEQVQDGHNGLVVPPDDAAALSAAVKALCGDPSRRLAMGRAGRERAERWFDGGRNYRSVLSLPQAMRRRQSAKAHPSRASGLWVANSSAGLTAISRKSGVFSNPGRVAPVGSKVRPERKNRALGRIGSARPGSENHGGFPWPLRLGDLAVYLGEVDGARRIGVYGDHRGVSGAKQPEGST